MEEKLVTTEVGQKLLTKDSACPSLPVKYRIWGFCICFILGLILSFFSTFMFIFGAIKQPYKFAVLYTLGNIVSLLSSFFLFGPCSQFKRMFKKTRVVATIICLFCIIFTLIYAIWIYKDEGFGYKLIMWILIIAQYLSMFWYILSYIPFARTICKKCCKCIIEKQG